VEQRVVSPIRQREGPPPSVSRPLKIAHLLYFTPPFMSGYTVRSRYILQEQTKAGIGVVAVSHPVMMSLGAAGTDRFDGVDYRRLRGKGPLIARLRKRLLGRDEWVVGAMAREILPILREIAPDLLHAHSPHVMGRLAEAAGRRLDLPVVYEMRGIWEDSGVATGKFAEGSAAYDRWRRLETSAARSAQVVVAISRGIKDDLAARGIEDGKIHVVPNGADPPPEIGDPDPALAGRHGLAGRFVIGYAGTLWKVEGLNLLVDAFARLVPRRPEAALLFVGDGASRRDLEEQARRLGIAGRVVFTGRVGHEEIWEYYKLMDVLVVPRPSTRVSERVTPIKPLEAMGAGRAVLVSRVGGLTELVREGTTGLAFAPGDPDDCARRLDQLAGDPLLRRRLGENARAWILEERTWTRVVAGYAEVYERALGAERSA